MVITGEPPVSKFLKYAQYKLTATESVGILSYSIEMEMVMASRKLKEGRIVQIFFCFRIPSFYECHLAVFSEQGNFGGAFYLEYKIYHEDTFPHVSSFTWSDSKSYDVL